MLKAPNMTADKIGFILSYPLNNSNPNNKIATQFNRLLVKLNHKYPHIFTSYLNKDYKVIEAYNDHERIVSNDNNLTRIKCVVENLDLIICFGEKAYFAAKKVKEKFKLNYGIIKTKSFANSVSRHIKTLYNSNNNKHVRTNFYVLTQFNDIDKHIKEL